MGQRVQKYPSHLPSTYDVFGLRSGSSSGAYLVLTTCPFLLLLDEVGRRGGWRRGPHAPDDANAVLREGGQTQLLAFVHLYALELLKTSKRELKQNGNNFILFTLDSSFVCDVT